MSRRRMLMAREKTRWEKSNIVVGKAISYMGHNDYLYVFPSGTIKIKVCPHDFPQHFPHPMFQNVGFSDEYVSTDRLIRIVCGKEAQQTYYFETISDLDDFMYYNDGSYDSFTVWIPYRHNAILSAKGQAITAARLDTLTVSQPTATRKPNVYVGPINMCPEEQQLQYQGIGVYTAATPPQYIDYLSGHGRGPGYANVKGWSRPGTGDHVSKAGIIYKPKRGEFKFAKRTACYYQLRGTHSHNRSIRTLETYRYTCVGKSDKDEKRYKKLEETLAAP